MNRIWNCRSIFLLFISLAIILLGCSKLNDQTEELILEAQMLTSEGKIIEAHNKLSSILELTDDDIKEKQAIDGMTKLREDYTKQLLNTGNIQEVISFYEQLVKNTEIQSEYNIIREIESKYHLYRESISAGKYSESLNILEEILLIKDIDFFSDQIPALKAKVEHINLRDRASVLMKEEQYDDALLIANELLNRYNDNSANSLIKKIKEQQAIILIKEGEYSAASIRLSGIDYANVNPLYRFANALDAYYTYKDTDRAKFLLSGIDPHYGGDLSVEINKFSSKIMTDKQWREDYEQYMKYFQDTEISYEKKRIEKREQAKKPDPSIGMTANEVINNSNWGSPNKKNKTTTESFISEQWVYTQGYIYLDNGIVTAIQE